MNTLALFLALASFALTLGTMIAYFRTIPQGKVPKRLGGWIAAFCLSIVLAILAYVSAIGGEGSAGLAVFLPAFLGLMFSSAFLWLVSQRKTPVGDIKVKVGDSILPFSAKTSDGGDFHTDELAGKRVLLKLFRGGWCPYCSAELVQFRDMQSDLAKYDVTLMALSKDVVSEAAIHKKRDGLDFTILSDANLDVIRQYGVEHHKALGQEKNTSKLIGGIPFGLSRFSFKTMAIPTTLLIDENGIIQWIDQTDDYRLRSSVARVMEAVRSAFGKTEEDKLAG